MKPTSITSLRSTSEELTDVSVDVSSETLSIVCEPLMSELERRPWQIPNQSGPIREHLAMLATRAEQHALGRLRVVMEPTGVYHKLLSRVARQMGFETCLVDPAHVKKLREVRYGDPGKSDLRDPVAISDVAAQGRVVIDRQLPEIYALLREWEGIYQRATEGVIEAKNQIHRLVHLLFPDFNFKSDFLYGRSGRAIQRCYGLNPARIAPLRPGRIFERLRKHSSIMRGSVTRLLATARTSDAAAPSARITAVIELQLAQAFEQLDLHTARRDRASAALESLYEEARLEDSNLPEPRKGVVSKTALARFLAHTGPLSDFSRWRQILRYAGLNLCERQSGKYQGQIRISRRGRPGLRHVLSQIALPLVKRNGLYGDYYHRKRHVEKMRGSKAMTAVSRKLVKMIWGWYRTAAAFEHDRVFSCESQQPARAA